MQRKCVCTEKLIGAQEFTNEELADPILADIAAAVAAGGPYARDPCLRRGLRSWEYGTRLPARLLKPIQSGY